MSLRIQNARMNVRASYGGPNILPPAMMGTVPGMFGARIGGITPYGGPRMINRGRTGQQGDFKSLLQGIGKAVGFIPGVGTLVGAGIGAVAGMLPSKKAKGASVASFAPTSGGGPGFGGGMPTLSGGGSFFGPDTPAGTAVTKYKGCAPTGYHPNKSGYWKNTSDLLPGASWIEPGSIMVRNRKRNPYNPRAASRAMSRLASLSQGMKTLERQLTKLAPKRRAVASRCGCKKGK